MSKTPPSKLAKDYAASVKEDGTRFYPATNKGLDATNPVIVILFTRGDTNYRMKLARVHVHPGDRDVVEAETKDMLGNSSWARLPDGSNAIPSPEWIVRRAMWAVPLGLGKLNLDSVWAIDLGKI